MNNNTTKMNSGMSFKLVDDFTTKNKKSTGSILNLLSRIIIVFLLSAGGIFTFSSMMKLDLNAFPIYLVIAVLSIAFICIYRFYKKHLRIVLSSIFLTALISLLFLQTVNIGVQAIYDSTIKSVYEAMFWTAPDPVLSTKDNYSVNITVTMALFSVIITSLTSLFVNRAVFFGAFLVTFPLFEVGAAFGCVSKQTPFAMLLAGYAAMLALHISNRQRNIVKHKTNKKAIKSKQFAYKDRSEHFGSSAIVMAVAVVLCFSIVSSILSVSGFARSESINQLRKDVKTYAIDIYDRITGFDHDATLKDGNLKVLGDRKVINRKHAVMQVKNVKKDIYLKGFTGSIYTGESWVNFNEDTYKQLDEAKTYLEKIEYILPTLQGDLLYTDLRDNRLDYTEFRISELRRKKDYVYAPSGIVSSVSITGFEDLYPVPEDKAEYSYKAYYDPLDFVSIPFTTSSKNDDYISGFSKYCNFVNQNYTLLPSGVDKIANLSRELQGRTLFETVDNVRFYLAENTTYSDKVQKLPDNTDFAEYFLFKKCVGYSAHYATAACVMLRSLGVPARYVEGFLVPEEQIEASDGDDNRKTVTITDENSHAWIEVFDPEFGWMQIEVTPGFYDTALTRQISERLEKEDNIDTSEPPEDNKNEEKTNDQPEQNINNEETETPTQDNYQEPEETASNYKINKFYERLYLILGIVVFVAVVIFITLSVRRKLILSKREKVFNSNDYREQVVLGFSLLTKMLKFKKINVQDAYSYDEYKQLLIKHFESDDAMLYDINKIIGIYEKALFSKQFISEQEATYVLDYIDEFGASLYEYLVVKERLKFKFIDVCI